MAVPFFYVVIAQVTLIFAVWAGVDPVNSYGNRCVDFKLRRWFGYG